MSGNPKRSSRASHKARYTNYKTNDTMNVNRLRRLKAYVEKNPNDKQAAAVLKSGNTKAYKSKPRHSLYPFTKIITRKVMAVTGNKISKKEESLPVRWSKNMVALNAMLERHVRIK